ncbi:MAG: hypothetical protein JNK05_37455 [Myxococcales bacterium]|nr:hypothetical protein [Myxococcales bacterium]
MVRTFASLAAACVLVASTNAHAQSETPPPVRPPVDPAQRDQLARIGLGSLASFGVMSIAMSLPISIVGITSPASNNAITATLITSAVASLALAPLAYAGAGALTNGRSSYLAALGGMLGGAVLGFIPIPIGLAGPSYANGPYIVASSVLIPLFGLAGQALAYELTQRPLRARDVPPQSSVRVWPTTAVTNHSATISLGGSFG